MPGHLPLPQAQGHYIHPCTPRGMKAPPGWVHSCLSCPVRAVAQAGNQHLCVNTCGITGSRRCGERLNWEQYRWGRCRKTKVR